MVRWPNLAYSFFVNKVLFISSMAAFALQCHRVEQLYHRPYGPKKLKYLLSNLSQKKLASVLVECINLFKINLHSPIKMSFYFIF